MTQQDSERQQQLRSILEASKRAEQAKGTTKTIRYSGDRTAVYDDESGTGLIGKVIGPDTGRRWFVVLDATYDAQTDRTTADLQQIRDPREVVGL